MKIKTGFYFIGWLLKRFFLALFKLPMKIHRSYMDTYQDNAGLGFIAWLVTSTIIVTVVGASILAIGPATSEKLELVKTTTVGTIITLVVYFIGCVIQDQYEKFDNERMATWDTLKD